MVFFCQRNCYEKEHTSTVISCTPSVIEEISNGKKNKANCYEVVFEDTVLFPEGGGQPYDKGTVNDVSVLKVIRQGGKAVHYLEKSLEVGASAHQIVDWCRRHDHMQQHSAQHLITAIADNLYGYPTLSWNLGEKISSIELGTPTLLQEEITKIEEIVNEKIREATPVIIDEFDSNDEKLKQIRTRGLPEDVVGPVRVVTIENVDSNMCCGTHVKNLADLQAIKLLYAEKGKANKMLLHFVAGRRVLRYLDECFTRERKLNTILCSNPQDHLYLVEKTKKDLKKAQKSLQESLRDLALSEASHFNEAPSKPNFYFHHRKDGTSEYLGTLISHIDNDKIFKFLTVGEDSGPGILIMHGPQCMIDKVSDKVCKILDGRGGGKTRFTAKISKVGKRKEAEKYIREHFNSTPPS